MNQDKFGINQSSLSPSYQTHSEPRRSRAGIYILIIILLLLLMAAFVVLSSSTFVVPNFVSNQTVINQGSVSGLAINGTDDRVLVLSDDAGNLTLLTPQDISTSSSPVFGGLTIGNLNGNLRADNGVLMVGGVNLGNEVEGVLGFENGGTGVSTTPIDGQILVGNGSGYTLKTLTAGSNISLTTTGTTLMINSTATGGGSTQTNAFVQNGNSFGGLAVLGTNDSFGLAFETSGTRRGAFDASGNFEIGPTGSPVFTLNTNGLAVLNSTLNSAAGNALRINHTTTNMSGTSRAIEIIAKLNNNAANQYRGIWSSVENTAGSTSGLTAGSQATIINNGTLIGAGPTTGVGVGASGSLTNNGTITTGNGLGIFGVITNNGDAVNLYANGSDLVLNPGSTAVDARGYRTFVYNGGAGTVEGLSGIRVIVTNDGTVSDRSGLTFSSIATNNGTFTGADARTANFNYANNGTLPEFYGLTTSLENNGTINGSGTSLYTGFINRSLVTGDWYGHRIQIINEPTGVINGDHIGSRIDIRNEEGTIDGSLIGLRVMAHNFNGAVDDLYGIHIQRNLSATTVDNSQYGLYIDAQDRGDINNYGIFIEGADSGSGTNASIWVNNGVSRFAQASEEQASLRIASSSGVDPISPQSGDLWWNGTQLYFYNGSSNVNLLAGGGGGSPGGLSGEVQFNDGGVFGGDSLFFWDNTENRLGVGTSTPAGFLDIVNPGNSGGVPSLRITSSQDEEILAIFDRGRAEFNNYAGGVALSIVQNNSDFALLNLAASVGGADPLSPLSGDLWWNGTNLYFNNGLTDVDLLAAGGGGSPGGSTGEIQFNAGGVFGGSSLFVWDGVNDRLEVGGTPGITGIINISGSTTSQSAINLAAGVDPSSPQSGDLWWNGTNLYFNDGSSNVDILAGGGGGGGSAIYSKWDPHAPPTSPSAMDDEFDDGSFNGTLWSTYNHTGAAFTPTDSDIGLRINWPSSPGGEFAGVYQPVPAGDFTFVTKVEAPTQGPITFPGMTFMQDATDPNGDLIHVFIFSHYDGESFQIRTYEDYQGNGEVTIKERQIFENSFFIRGRYNSGANELDIDYSVDGITYSHYLRMNPSFTIQDVGLLTRGEGGDIESGFQFFRYRATYDDVYEPTYGQLVPQGGGGGGSTGSFVEFEPGTTQVGSTGNPFIDLRYEGTSFTGDALINVVNGASSDFPFFLKFAEEDGVGGEFVWFEVNDVGDVFVNGTLDIGGFCSDDNGGDGGSDGCDVAETFASNDDLEKGEIVKLDPNPGDDWKLITRTSSSEDVAIGVISSNPTIVMGNTPFSSERAYPVGLAGILPTKVTDENGLIQRGDYVTISNTPGHGMRANPGDYNIGIALESQIEVTDVINVLVSRNNQGNFSTTQNNNSLFISNDSTASSLESGLSQVMGLNPVQFKSSSGGLQDIGLLVEEVKNVNPLLVSSNSIRYNQITTLLVQAVKEINIRLEKAEKQLAELNNRVTNLEKQNIHTGDAVVPAGKKELFVEVQGIGADSSITLTPKTLLNNVSYYVEGQKNGFLIKLSSTQPSDIAFNYLIVVNK